MKIRRIHALFLGLLAAGLLEVFAPVGALAKPITIAEEGSGAGQVSRPLSVAVNPYSPGGPLYVADLRNMRVDEFAANDEFALAWGFGVLNGADELQLCTTVTGCRQGTGERLGRPGSHAGPGFFFAEAGLAVGPSGEVWVSDGEPELQVQEFGPSGEPLRVITGSQFSEAENPLAVDQRGDLWVGDANAVQEFSPTGAHIGTVSLPALGDTLALAVTPSGGDLYVISTAVSGVREGVLEFETGSGKQVGGVIDETGEAQALTLDSHGDLYVGGECKSVVYGFSPTGQPLYKCSSYDFKEYDEAGVQVEQFGAGEVFGEPGRYSFYGGANAIAVTQNALYAATTASGSGPNVVQRFAFPVPGPLPGNEAAGTVGVTSATIEATLDPENHGTTYRFEYGTEPGVYTQSTTVESLPGLEWSSEPVHADLNGLLPGTTYYFRLTATNSQATVSGEGASFTTKPAVGVESQSVVSVTSDTAGFAGTLNPLGEPARWWVEYGSQEGALTGKTGVGSLAAGSTGVNVNVEVAGLAPSTVYYYRFVGSDEREGHPYTIHGPVLSFTTQAAQPSFSLLDGRAWEMVSPLDKHGAGFLGLDNEGAINQAAVDGGGFTYPATASIETGPAGEPSPEAAQVLSEHNENGWSSHDIATPHEREWLPKAGRFTEFFAFSPDLSVGLIEPHGTTLLGGASERTPYLRRNALCKQDRSVGSECYLPLVTEQNVTTDEKWGGEPSNGFNVILKLEAVAPDLAHVLLHSEVPLTEEAAGSKTGLYEWSSGGKLELVSTLPETGAPAGGCPRVSELTKRHVISDDGDRVIWEDICEGGGLYMHEASVHRTVQIAPGPGFADASSDASRVFFGSPELFVFEANPDGSEPAGVVREVSMTVHKGESAGVVGVSGASANGSVVYFVARGVLSEMANERGEKAQRGASNLYRAQRVEGAGSVVWKATLIAVLGADDEADLTSFIEKQTTEVSSSGQWFAFMSDRSLTGYDNRDVVSGVPDEEVFLYDGASGRLVCASCDPSGARPHGVQGGGRDSLLDQHNTWTNRWLAGLVPGWDVASLFEGVYQPRYLSASGRLFFDSVDALVPGDTNATSDVYEFEPAGVGSCTTGSPSYSASQAGCIGLMSSGISSEETVFLDASETGNDVFFLTAGKLVAGDTDSAYDVYDAHVCGSGWACPVPGVVSPPCTNTSSCRGAPEPQPSVFGPAGSATFSGEGNVTGAASPKAVKKKVVKRKRPVKCGRGRVKRKGRCVRSKHRGGRGK